MARTQHVRTTIRLPRVLYDEVRHLVDENLVQAETFNDFLISAVRAYLNAWRRKQIDAAFAAMAADSAYQKEALAISEEFARSDWEAFQIAEREQ